MQWGFTLGSDKNMKQWIVDVPDGAYPPNIGESVHFTKGLEGTFKVESRLFLANMPYENVGGSMTWAWSFVLQKSDS